MEIKIECTKLGVGQGDVTHIAEFSLEIGGVEFSLKGCPVVSDGANSLVVLPDEGWKNGAVHLVCKDPGVLAALRSEAVGAVKRHREGGA